jgi:DNA-binding NtrC family response regulator
MTARVVVVDDDKDMLTVMIRMLDMAGINAVPVNDVNALNEVLSGLPSAKVVILDVWHDGHDAFGTLDMLKKSFPQIKVLMMSGGGGPVSIETSVAMANISNPDGFLMKPFSKDQLVDALNDLLAPTGQR